LIIFSTFVGYVAGGLAGGLAMTVGIFLPAFVSAVLAAIAFVVLYRFQAKLTVLSVVLGCGLIGAALQLTVV
jgi:chromate transport protein ChrA